MSTSLHAGVAERGKQLAVAGQHSEALRHYREAMQLVKKHQEPEIFLRYYTQCALESLEHMGAWNEVIAACENAEAHYQQYPPHDDVTRKDRASFLERAGVVLLRQEKTEEASAKFQQALRAAAPLSMPISSTLLGWLRTRLHLSKERLESELKRQKYWSVRAECIRDQWAIALPAAG